MEDEVLLLLALSILEVTIKIISVSLSRLLKLSEMSGAVSLDRSARACE